MSPYRRWSLRQLRHIIRDDKPRRLALDMDMEFGPDAGIVVQRAKRHADIRDAVEHRDDRRAADAAETAIISRRRLIERHDVFALDPFELRCLRAGATSECRALGLAAHGAMTVERAPQHAFDAVLDPAAQAAATDHALTLSRPPAIGGLQRARLLIRTFLRIAKWTSAVAARQSPPTSSECAKGRIGGLRTAVP